MAHSLERLLIYTDKKRIDEFDIPEVAFDELYELYVTTKDDVLEDHHTSVDFFNEVFYYLTCVYANDDAAENINAYLYSESALLPSVPELVNPQTKEQAKSAREFKERTEEINCYVLEFVWVILKKQKELPKHVRFFLVALEHAIEDAADFRTFEDFVKKHPAKYTMTFDIQPEFDLSICFCTTQEWKEATYDFDQVVVEHIIRRFNAPDARETLVAEIRKALAKANKDPNSSPRVSMVSHRLKATNKFLDELLKQKEEEDKQQAEKEQAIEKTKDERITELEEQVKTLTKEKQDAIRYKEDAERERDRYRKNWEDLNSRLNRKFIPAELKSEEAKLIIKALIEQDLITPLGHNTGVEFVVQMYRWDGSGALFGYFVDKMNFQLELADSGGRLNWKPFKQAFSNYEEKEKRARDTVSYYKQHPEVKMPEKAEKIDEAIANAEKIISEKKKQPQPPKIKLG